MAEAKALAGGDLGLRRGDVGNVIQAIARGLRGFPGGTTLFAEPRGARNVGRLPSLTERQILTWADDFFAAHGEWPTCRCPVQAIPGTPGERWFNVDQALRKGLRGLRGGSSLLKLLADHRRVPNRKATMTDPMSGRLRPHRSARQ
jgi:hypothetical protein